MEELSEANVSSSHTVSQFVLVPDERHEAYIRLDLDGLIQDQNAIGLPRNWLQSVGFQGCILQLLTEVMDLWTRQNNCWLNKKKTGHLNEYN